MVDAPGAGGGAVVSRARDWKGPIGRIGLVGQGVVATIIGLLAIRIAMGEKDEAATSEGAVAWLAAQPLGKFLLIALTVALFALAVWRFLCAVMGDPVEGSEPKDRLKYAVLGVVYLLLAITTLGVTIANWTGSGDTESGSEQSGDEGSQQAASTLFDWPAGRWLVGILGVAVIGGLLVSQVLTLYMTPVLYVYMEQVAAATRAARAQVARVFGPPWASSRYDSELP